MTRNERGFALIYTSVVLVGLLLFTGLAVDSGRAYLVKAQLTKAVDGAALAAARNLNSGDPRAEAARIFTANFPSGYLGTTAADPTAAPGFF
ncbi:MAG: pilus assembly protein TadG-related protein [Vicinamibacterales bacterium]